MKVNLSIETITESLKKEGFFLIEEFLSDEPLNNIIKEFDNVFAHIPDSNQAYLNSLGRLELEGEATYKPGKHLRVLQPAYTRFPLLINVFNTENMKKIVDSYCGINNNYMMQIFMSHEFNVCSAQKNMVRNNWLHFDPYPALKYFLYLTDVVPGGGATCAVPNSRAYGRKYREKMSLDDFSGLAAGYRNRLEDWEQDPKFTNKDATPIYAKAGSLLIFDTDILHYGGLITEDNVERKTILIHNRPYNLQMPVHD